MLEQNSCAPTGALRRAVIMTTPDVRIAIRTFAGHPKGVNSIAISLFVTIAQYNRQSPTIPANAKTGSLGNGLTKANVRFNQRVKDQSIPAIVVKPPANP
jgi:hypothetical protein